MVVAEFLTPQTNVSLIQWVLYGLKHFLKVNSIQYRTPCSFLTNVILCNVVTIEQIVYLNFSWIEALYY